MSEVKRRYSDEQWSDKPVYSPLSIQGVRMALLQNGDVEAYTTGTKPEKVGRLQSEDGSAWIPKHKNANSLLKWMVRDGDIDHLIDYRKEQLERRRHLRKAAPDLLEALEWALEWIDSVPDDVPLPAMPGFDRDAVESVIAKAKGEP